MNEQLAVIGNGLSTYCEMHCVRWKIHISNANCNLNSEKPLIINSVIMSYGEKMQLVGYRHTLELFEWYG